MSDSVGQYLNEIGLVPLLTAQEERELSQVIEKGRDAAARLEAGKATLKSMSAQLEEKAAQRALAQQQYERNATMYKQDAVSRDALQSTLAASKVAAAQIETLRAQHQRVAVIAVDPSSPLTGGAILGDRIRMSEWYNNPNIFIRSLATRGSLGGLHPKIIEISDLLKAAPFDYIFIETVGVGQSEIEIAGLADVTVVVMVPEAGDEVQTMKAGLMEIADIFVINKADRPAADTFAKHIGVLAHSSVRDIPVVKTIASAKSGIDELAGLVLQKLSLHENHERKYWLLAERAYQLIRNYRMRDISKETLKTKIKSVIHEGKFNLYSFASKYQ